MQGNDGGLCECLQQSVEGDQGPGHKQKHGGIKKVTGAL